MSKLLLDEEPLVIIPSLAVAIGLNEAIVLQQLHYWIKKSNHIKDGRPWVYNTIPDWAEQFPFWGEKTVRRTFDSLVNMQIVLKGNYNEKKTDRTTWYSIDYTKFNEIASKAPKRVKKTQKPKKEIANGQNDQLEKDKVTKSNGQVDHLQEDKMGRSIPESTSEITTENPPSLDQGDIGAHEMDVEPPSKPKEQKGDGMPITAPDIQDEISPAQWLTKIEEHYLMRHGRMGFCASPKDVERITRVIKSGIPLESIIEGIDIAFDTKEPEYEGDTIRNFEYCAKVIRRHHYEKMQREKALRGLEKFNPDEAPAQPSGPTKPYIGGKRGYKNQRKDELPPLIVEQMERQQRKAEAKPPAEDNEVKRRRVQELLKEMGEVKA